MNSHHKQSGFLKIIVLIVIAIAILAYFKVDIRGLIDNISSSETFTSIWTTVKDFGLKIWTIVADFWQEYISPWFQSQTS